MTRSRTSRIALSVLFAVAALASATPEAHARNKRPTLRLGCSTSYGSLKDGQTHHEYLTCPAEFGGALQVFVNTCINGTVCTKFYGCGGIENDLGCYSSPAAVQLAPTTTQKLLSPTNNLSFY